MDDDERPFCSCGSSEQVLWAAAFDRWLCATCRREKTYGMLDTVVTAIPVNP